MSRRGGADRATENQQTIKNLLKLQANKVCADCKKNKHPRWASWNIGVFICIRCSGIHRGMGTHISRVKSVDLDTWTDAQLQSVLNWGNSRANKYWEAKLAAGHVPSEAKIENFIRTKYESKRWVMEGPIPDPATLDADDDDDVPLSIVQEKAKIERSASERQRSVPNQIRPQPQPVAATIDLFSDDKFAPAARPNTTENSTLHPESKNVAPSTTRQNRQGDSLLGLELSDKTASSGPVRPQSASPNYFSSTGQSRPDLKQSILSLYSAAPKSQGAAPSQDQQPSYSHISSPPATQSLHAFGGLTDAFGGMSFTSSNTPTSPPPPPKPSSAGANIFATSAQTKSAVSAPQLCSPPPLGGGGFFDTLSPKGPEQPKYQAPPTTKPSNGPNSVHVQTSGANSTPSPSKAQGLFAEDRFAGFASTEPPPVPSPTKVASPSMSNFKSAFNLPSVSSAPSAATSKSTAASKAPPIVSQDNATMFDPWATNDTNTWVAPDPALAPSKPKAPSVYIGKSPAQVTSNDMSGGWGRPILSSQEHGQTSSITEDEDYGGWTSAAAEEASNTAPTTAPTKPSGGFGAAPDPFDNPWG